MIFYGRFVKSITERVQSRLANATQEAEERIGNVRTVRAFAQEKNETARFGKAVDDVLAQARKDAVARATFFGVVSEASCSFESNRPLLLLSFLCRPASQGMSSSSPFSTTAA